VPQFLKNYIMPQSVWQEIADFYQPPSLPSPDASWRNAAISRAGGAISEILRSRRARRLSARFRSALPVVEGHKRAIEVLIRPSPLVRAHASIVSLSRRKLRADFQFDFFNP
jgi:hypothetical protein